MTNNFKIKDEYKSNVLWASARYAALQRGNIYKKEVKGDIYEPRKKEFREFSKNFLLEKVFKQYFDNEINDDQLHALIKEYIASIRKGYPDIIKEGEGIYGNAQKLINVYLKSMWVVGWLKGVPPHFPVDRIMVRILKVRGNDRKLLKWTEMDEDEYRKVIETAKNEISKDNDKERKAKKYLHIAEWELEVYAKSK